MVEEKRLTKREYYITVLATLLSQLSNEQYADEDFVLKIIKDSKEFSADTIEDYYKRCDKKGFK
jgi:hypothetical protein